MGLFMNGFKRPSKISEHYIPPFWGDGSDGVLTTGATYHAGVDFEKYSGFCIKQFSSINWDPVTEETLTVEEPCRGLVLLVDGDVFIGENATISMAKKGSILPCNPGELIDSFHESKQMRHIVDELKTLDGGAGGDSGYGGSHQGAQGLGGISRICQGGFGGGGPGNGYETTGGDGGSIIRAEGLGHGGRSEGDDGIQGGGGSGASAAANNNWKYGGHPYGAGAAGGGVSHPGGDGEHTGGFILIIARGSIAIAGTLDVTGGDGGACGSTYAGAPGGGAGGGVIAVFASGLIDTSTATKVLDGGQPGIETSPIPGTAGNDGTYYEEQI